MIVDLITKFCSYPKRKSLSVLVMLAFGLGSIMIAVSYFADFANLVNGDNKNIGYMDSINWGIIYVTVYPLLAGLTAYMLAVMKSTLERIYSTSMIMEKKEDGSYAPVSIAEPFTTFLEENRLLVNVSLMIMLMIIIGISCKEWYEYSYNPNINNNYSTLEIQKKSLDFGQAAKFGVNKYLIVTFTFISNVVMQSSLIFMVAIVVVLSMIFSLHLVLLNSGRMIIPDLRSQEKRMGFEEFEELGVASIIIASVCLIALLCVTIQMQFLAKENISNSVMTFLNVFDSANIKSVLKPLPFSDPSTALAHTAAIVVCLVLAVVIPVVLLTFLAYKAKRNYRKLLDSGKLTDIVAYEDAVALTEKVNAIPLWPYSFAGWTYSVLFVVFYFGSLEFPRLLPFIFVALLTSTTNRVIKVFSPKR